MSNYRFMSEKWIGAALDGKIRLTSLDHYRLMEVVFEDGWIGDTEEGVARTTLTELEFTSDCDQPVLRERLRDVGIVLSNSCGAINGSEVIRMTNGFVVCFASGDIDSLREAMCQGEYDSCIEVDDLQGFAMRILQTGITSKGIHLKDVFGAPVVSRVVYSDEKSDIRYRNAAAASPFLKRDKYKGQCEVRIFFPLLAYVHDYFIDVVFNPGEGIVKEIFRGVETKASQDKPPLVFPDHPIKELLIILGEIDNYYEGGSPGDEVIDEIIAKYSRRALLAYWVLRTEERSRNLELFFINPSWSGGTVTGFRSTLREYLAKVMGYEGSDVMEFLIHAYGDGVKSYL